MHLRLDPDGVVGEEEANRLVHPVQVSTLSAIMANMARSSTAVVSVSFRGIVLDRVELGWSTDDPQEDGLRYIQRWTGSGVTRLSTQVLGDGRDLKEALVEELAGEILSRALLADVPKSEMRRLLRLANESEPRADDATLEIDGTSTAGLVLPFLATPIGEVSGAAVRHGQDTIVVIHDGDPHGGISLRTAAEVDGAR